METITIKDIAKLCGVGVSTVSRAINNHPDINNETKTMIINTIKQYNYVPNNSARNLKRVEAKAIAILVKGITNPFFSSMIKVMEEVIEEKKYSLVLHHVEGNEDEVDVALELVKEKRLRGILFLGGYFTHTEEKLRQLNVPFVISTISATGCVEQQMYSSVSVDDFEESYKMVQYLCELGHRNIAILASREEDRSIGRLRLDGYMKALSDHKIPFRKELVLPMDTSIEEYSMKNGYVVMKEFLQKKIPCTAVYAIADSLAIGACRAILESGKKVPEDFSVAGFDGIEAARFYSPSITTIEQPVEDLARESISTLFEMIKNKNHHVHKIFKANLIIRESTGKPTCL
ncbi:LacI family DNA-binding transcriptional regulator [Lachnoclostridium phytofermentans]|uniref:Transcriptional regulator, LacI family n=1 Tax=Lachnoclostridium phytofermentans (strain ATCC 700394 / DSM 18823 / ISDg) TaxID=357809 RepID=A9KML0_LACP7|nr:LacI family DNA-binding transcriptional regulator [Lachnoclostridium phytofermentans]ABX41455.1 transcriptional regulator, LacI family [Lachnoclostridium phytofermentans ISDg]